MPPRYVYWTILIDGQPTAFRAHTREELLPTLNQLKRHNPAIEMRWFAHGKLWDSPEQAAAARQNPPPAEARDRGWRPGGEHRDPRERFKRKKKDGRKPFHPKPDSPDRNASRDRPASPAIPPGASASGRGRDRDARQEPRESRHARPDRPPPPDRSSGESAHDRNRPARPPFGPRKPFAPRERRPMAAPFGQDQRGPTGAGRKPPPNVGHRPKPFGDDRRTSGSRPQGTRPAGGGSGPSRGFQPFGPGGRPPFRGKPFGAKPFGSKPSGAKPTGSGGGRPTGATRPLPSGESQRTKSFDKNGFGRKTEHGGFIPRQKPAGGWQPRPKNLKPPFPRPNDQEQAERRRDEGPKGGENQ